MMTKQTLGRFFSNAYACGKHYNPRDHVEICRDTVVNVTIDEVKEELKSKKAEFEITKDKIIIKSYPVESWK